jgi:3',5'-nucleoside bisphosphate phosphatase
MKTVKADLHIHTVLSPCGDLDMSPRNIVEQAREKNLQIIGITDHNSTLQVEVVEELAARVGIFVLGGVEITTREEVHCLAFFPDRASRRQFQKYLDSFLPDVPNKAGAFGYQVVVDEFDNILYTEEKLLITGINRSINQIEKEVHRLNGIFIPAHVDRPVNSLFSQLGFIPPDLKMEAMGITCYTTESDVRRKFSIPENITLIKNSDAHYPDDIGRGYSLFTLEECAFQEVRLALLNQEGRSVKPA